MTWSIVARDASGALGVAIATRFFAVGALCPYGESSVGALSTQALVNPYYGIDGVRLLREGKSLEEIVQTLIAADSGRESRQLHILDVNGRIAAHTGRDCVEWCGHVGGDGFSIAGNMLAGAGVLHDTAKAYAANQTLPFARRLITAMRAGEAAGGDKRGKQSAALLIYGSEEWSALDLRVDDHPDPLCELERLEHVSRERWVQFRKFLPTRDNPAGITDRAMIDAAIEALAASARSHVFHAVALCGVIPGEQRFQAIPAEAGEPVVATLPDALQSVHRSPCVPRHASHAGASRHARRTLRAVRVTSGCPPPPSPCHPGSAGLPRRRPRSRGPGAAPAAGSTRGWRCAFRAGRRRRGRR